MSIARKILMGSSGGKKSTYVDDVFSTYVYKGNNGSQTITNGIDNSEGGLLWTKARNVGESHTLFDTERASNKAIYTNLAERDETRNFGLNFLSDGFSWNTSDGMVNNASYNYAAWNFRKAPGFFDVLTYTGNGSNRTIAHNLGSVPGCILIKCTSENGRDWTIFHRGVAPVDPASYRLRFTNNPRQGNAGYFNSTEPTSTHFSLGSNSDTNANGQSYVAYVFAGGASTAATARSVNFDASGDYLSLASSSDLAMGTGDFTVEGWFKVNGGSNYAFWMNGANGLGGDLGLCVWYYSGSSYGLTFNNGSDQTTNVHPPTGQWFHLAYVRSSGTTSLYYNGRLLKSASNTINYTNQTFVIGGYSSTSYLMNGSVSNFRVVKGTAVYTSSFRPPTEPLTNITNTKLLCCNNSSPTGSTVTPSTITAHGNPTVAVDASGTFSDSPFDDPEGFQFGKEGDQNLVKCGTYDGNPNSANIDVEIGWEPQFFMVKNLGIDNANNEWLMWDSARGIFTNANDPRLSPTESATEYGGMNGIDLSSNGIRVRDGDGRVNGGSGAKLIYIAIRRSDGLVGKPPEAGTDALAMDRADGSSTPCFISDFPVDFSYYRTTAASGDWYVGNRLMGKQYINTFNNMQETTSNNFTWDYSNGWRASGLDSNWMAWMWKRGPGLDVVYYEGMSTARTLNHNLGGVPEMIWVRNLNWNVGWFTYHMGVNGGINPTNYGMSISGAGVPYSYSQLTISDATFGYLHGASNNNYVETNTSNNNASFVAVLFRSVAGISKCGYYTGSSSELTITTGFQPRFVIIKNTTNTGNNWTTGWFTFDTTRGWAAGNNDYYMRLNDTGYQDAGSQQDWTNPISTGFTINANSGNHLNNNGENYIYYAHA